MEIFHRKKHGYQIGKIMQIYWFLLLIPCDVCGVWSDFKTMSGFVIRTFDIGSGSRHTHRRVLTVSRKIHKGLFLWRIDHLYWWTIKSRQSGKLEIQVRRKSAYGQYEKKWTGSGQQRGKRQLSEQPRFWELHTQIGPTLSPSFNIIMITTVDSAINGFIQNVMCHWTQ